MPDDVDSNHEWPSPGPKGKAAEAINTPNKNSCYHIIYQVIPKAELYNQIKKVAKKISETKPILAGRDDFDIWCFTFAPNTVLRSVRKN